MSSGVESSNSSGRVIIVDIYTTVAKILGKAFLIAMPWNGGWTGGKIIFDKNSFPGLLIGKFIWDWSALLLDFIFFPLHWSGITRRLITRATWKVGRVKNWVFYLSIYRRVTIIYADVMHEHSRKRGDAPLKMHSLLSNGHLRGELLAWCKRKKFNGYYAQYTCKVTHRSW